MIARVRAGWLIGLGALVVLLFLPVLLGAGQLYLPTEVCIFALFALTYDIVFGFTGLISFGQALFIGVGAYAMANALSAHHLPFWLALIVVLFTGIIISAITGALALRTRGVYFAMVTLAFAQAAFTLAQSDVGGLTGGDNGYSLTGVPSWLTGPGTEAHFYYVALASLVAGFLLLRLVTVSPAGRVWQAIRENEQRSLMVGYRPFAFKLLSYTVSGTVATLAGALYAIFVTTVSPNMLSADMTIQLLLMVIIGGAGSLWGAILGAAIVRYLDYYLNILSTEGWVASLPPVLHNTIGQPLLIFGVVYLLLVYFFPQGIAGLTQRWALFRSAVPQPGLGEVEARSATTAGEEPSSAESPPLETLPRG